MCKPKRGQGFILVRKITQIFQRFYRGSNVKEEEGVGIGLFLTKQIIERQGGYLCVNSKLGKGTSFFIYFRK